MVMFDIHALPEGLRQLYCGGFPAGPPAASSSTTVEPWDLNAKDLPPRWCDVCEVGCSVDNCWLCAMPTVPTRRRSLPSGAVVNLIGFGETMRWQPEAAT